VPYPPNGTPAPEPELISYRWRQLPQSGGPGMDFRDLCFGRKKFFSEKFHPGVDEMITIFGEKVDVSKIKVIMQFLQKNYLPVV
jgi:hypothetical protein